MIGPKNALILDFFAGSGTTLHATMQLNAEDGGNRQCIMVTNNENNIAEEVCYERNKRVIQGYENAKGQQVPGLTNNNLRYYRCGLVPRRASLENKRELTRRATDLLCIKEGMFAEIATLGGQVLVPATMRCFGQENSYLLVLYDDLIIAEAVDLIRHALAESGAGRAHFKVYVFSNGAYPFTEEFEDVLASVTLCALPDALYKAYRSVLPDPTSATRIATDDETETAAPLLSLF